MPLLNYTTEVQVGRSVGQVHEILIKAGARSILSEFDEAGRPKGVSFLVETPHGPRGFRLPVNVDRVLSVLVKDRSVQPRFKTREQAERVAWRIAKDWLEAQLAIVATEMVSFDQVMLPYMQDGRGHTLYELYLDNALGLPALAAG